VDEVEPQHRIGRAHALHVIKTTDAQTVVTVNGDEALLWVGFDDRGVALEVIAVVAAPDALVVIHVMPVDFRS
jgi:hypothetical protein